MNYIKTNNGSIVEYPYQIGKIRQENPNTSFPSEMPNHLLAEYGVFPVEPTEQPVAPEDHYVAEATPQFVNGVWKQQWVVVEQPVPYSITPRQVRLLLLQQGLLPQVLQMIETQGPDIKIAWEYASEFRRDDPLLNQLASNLGLTNIQIDQFFRAASKL